MNSRPYSTPPPGRTSWWRKLTAFGAALALFGGAASAQCTFGTLYTSFVAPGVGITSTITTCQYAGEYNAISGITAGYQYTLNGNSGIAYCTVHEGSPAGPVIGFGPTPLAVTATASGSFYPHWSTNAACGTQTGCKTTTITTNGATTLCTGTPAPGTVPATLNNCANTPTAVTVTGYTTGVAGIAFAWEESDDNNTGDPWAATVGGSGATTASYTSPAFVGTRYYRCRVTCTNSGLFDYTGSCAVNQNAPCQFTIARNTGVTYTSIFGTGESTYTFSNVSTDDGATAATSLAGTTFSYKGTTVTGFRAGTNGWMTFNTALAPTAYTNAIGLTATANAALCPLWDDLICSPNNFTAAAMDGCMRYKIIGTLGSGTAQIIIEWREMDNYAVPSTSINFQVILDELGNTITYRYGRMEGFTGGANTSWSYSLGLNAWAGFTATSYTAVMAMRDEGTTNFDYTPATVASSGLNGNMRVPTCYSEYVFTPAAAYPGPGAAPSAPPANDEIAGAEVLTVNPTLCAAGDLCGTYRSSQFATATAGIPVCSAVTPGTPDDDVWFKFNANASSATVRVISGSGNDCVVQLLDATGTTALYCVNASGLGLIETINATGLNPGSDYLVRVYNSALGTPTTTRNDFAICVAATPVPPTNDECAGAISLTPGIGCTPIAGNSFVATGSVAVVGACAGNADDDVWYSFVAPGTGAVVRVQSITSYNAAFDVYSSTTNDCTTLTNIACVNSTPAAGLEQVTLTTLTPGNTYFVRVFHSIGGSANGQFTICVDAGPQCPSLSAPADGATSITLPVQLSWGAGTFATGYDVYFDTSNPPLTPVSSNQPGTTFDMYAPGPNGTYYWRVEARNGLGATTSCATRSVIVNIPSCPQPSAVSVGATSGTSATVSWLCGACVGTYIVEYGAPGFIPGTGASAGAGTVVTSAGLSAAMTGLTANTLYDIYVRQECIPSVDYSLNTGPISFKSAEVLCGANYYDSGGSGAAYGNSENIVRTFCGASAGEVVAASFNSFSTESGWDPLYVFNGPSTASPKIASVNGVPAGNNVYGTGGWWGTSAPNGGTVVSSHPSGCLTFAFTSDTSVPADGWDASISCAAPSPCTVPSGVAATGVTSTTANVSWTCVACTGTGPYILEYGISGFVPGTGAAAGVGGTVISPATSPVALTGLASGVTYKVYVRQDCDGLNTTFSNNSYAPATFTTGPGCGSNFYDIGGPAGLYPNNMQASPDIRTICPTIPTDKVIVTFSSFQVESSFDPLYVFNGTSVADPMIASANGAPFASPNYGAGGWWGTVAPTNTGIPGVVIATNPSGCLTFGHISDTSVNQAGWTALVSCASPQYDCTTSGTIACGDQKTGFTFGGTNTLPVGGCDFNGGASTSGVSWWAYSALATEDVSLSTCGLTTMDTRISVYKPLPDCANLQCVGANDDGPGCPNGTSTMRFKADAGQLYYIAVSGNAANNGIFQLQLFCQPVCNLDINDNDACGSATPITVQLDDGLQVLLDDDNSCSYVDGPTSCSGTSPAVGNWYSFTSNAGSIYRAYVVDNTISGAKTAQAMQYALYDGSCTDLLATGPVACNGSGAGFTNLPALTPNAPYKLFVYNNGSNSQVGSFGVWVDSPALYDADVTAVTSPVGTVCNLTLSPVVTLQNNGQVTLTSAALEVSFDGGPAVAVYNWSGSLATGASTSVTLDLITVPAGVHTITVTAQNPNALADQIPANDGASAVYDATGQTVVVTVKTGNSGSQCNWGVYDAFFFPVGLGGPYTGQNNQTITTNVCLATTFGSCFYFFVFDDAGDGLVDAGGWDLNDSQGRSILRDNGAFIGQSPSLSPASPIYFAHEFCLPLGPSPIQAAECNVFSNYLNNKVYTTAVGGATNYQFEFSDPNAGFYRRISLPRNWVKFGEMVSTPLVYGTTYYCRARADQGAAGFGDDFYGAGCEMALAVAQPVCTELISTPGPTLSCGVTKTFGGSSKIWAQPVTYATQYRFSFVGMIDPDGPNPLPTDTIGVDGVNDPPVMTTRNIVRSSYVNPLNWSTYTLVNGQTYNVSVECFIGGNWSGYCGAVCTVTINNTPGQGGRIGTETEGSSVSLWPNPVRDGRVNLVISDLVDATQMITVDVYDVFGKRVMTQHFENAGQVFNTVLDLDADLAAGNYTVNITVNDELYTERLNVVR